MKVGLGGWYSGIILVSGTRDPGFNSRIALIFNKTHELDENAKIFKNCIRFFI